MSDYRLKLAQHRRETGVLDHAVNTSQSGLRVCMLVNNDCVSDTRVRNEAATLSDAGYCVTILALQSKRVEDDLHVEHRPERFAIRRLPKKKFPTRPLSQLMANWARIQTFSLLACVDRHVFAYSPRQATRMLRLLSSRCVAIPGLSKRIVIRSRRRSEYLDGDRWDVSYLLRRCARRVLDKCLLVLESLSKLSADTAQRASFVFRLASVVRRRAARYRCIALSIRLLKYGTRWIRRPLRIARQWHRRQLRRVFRSFRDGCKPILNAQNHCETFLRDALAEEADVYHVNDLPMLLVGSLIADIAGKPLVYDSHELWLERAARSRSWKARGAILQAFLVRHWVSRAITVNESIAEEHRKRYDVPDPVVLRNCSVPIDAAARSSRIRDALGLPKRSFIALFHGGFGRLRGLHNLVAAATYLEGSDAHIVLMGKGGDEYKLRANARIHRDLARHRGASYNLHFLPFVPESELMEWVCSSDVGLVVYPRSSLNTYLSSPNKIFQYLMAGVPVITVDHPEKRRLVLENSVGPVGIVIPDAIPRDIADVILHLAEDRELQAVYRSNARRLCDEELNWREESKKLTALYAELLSVN